MIAEHAAAVLALLRADSNLTVYDGSPPDLAQPPYVVVWVSLDTETTDRLTSKTTRASFRVTTHSVATTGEGARIVAGRVRKALLDVRPQVPGCKTWPIRHELGVPPQRDENTGWPFIDQVDAWTFDSTPNGEEMP